MFLLCLSSWTLQLNQVYDVCASSVGERAGPTFGLYVQIREEGNGKQGAQLLVDTSAISTISIAC
jgi:hypothetical protein